MTTEEVTRFDAARAFETTPQGGIRAGAYVDRAGVKLYRRGDGTVVREYTPPDVLFAPATLRAMEHAPITRGHPKTTDGLITPATYQRDQVGTIVGPRREGAFVAADLLVQDATTLDAVKRGELAEISPGYRVVLDRTPGVTPEGEPYDAKRLALIPNHFALYAPGLGRGGPEVRIRLDAMDAIEIESAEPHAGEERHMKNVRLDGVDYAVDDAAAPHLERAFAAVVGARDTAQTDLVTTKKKLEETEGRLDATTIELTETKTKLEAATDPKAFAERVANRAKLERSAQAILGAEVKLDALSDDEIRRKAIEQRRPGTDLKGKSADYVRGVFEALPESQAEEARTDASEALDEPLAKKGKSAARDAREKMVDRHAKAADLDDHKAN